MSGTAAIYSGDLPVLPASWRWAQVQDLAVGQERAITDGPFGSNLKTEHYTDSGPRVIRLQNIGDGEFIDSPAHISRDRFEVLRHHDARAGDVVMASLGEVLPRACVVPEWLGDAIVKADCPRLRPHPALNPHYVAAMLNSEVVRSQARRVVHGVGRPRLKLAELRKLHVPLAPREDQDRLVAVLDSQLALVRDGLCAFERALQGLLDFRVSLLHELLTGHPTKPLGGVATVATGVTKGRRTRGETSPQAFLRAANLRDGSLDLSEIKTIDVTEDELARYRLEPGDSLMVEGSGSAGRLGQGWIWEGQVIDCLHQNHVFRARPNQDVVLPRFLSWVLQSPSSRTYFLGFAKTTSGLSTVNKRQVSSLPVPLPPKEEQTRIIRTLDAAQDGIVQARRNLQRQKQDAQSLRTSLRTSAGLGKLLVSSNTFEETAEALLIRIKSEQAELSRKRKEGRASKPKSKS
jgi:type I restriction enzyme S subunit